MINKILNYFWYYKLEEIKKEFWLQMINNNVITTKMDNDSFLVELTVNWKSIKTDIFEIYDDLKKLLQDTLELKQ